LVEHFETMSLRVLVVEDNEAMGVLVVSQLTRRGHAAKRCTSGADALTILEHEVFDVVLSDINMPGMSGLELCQRLTDNRPDIPVVVITAFGTMETAISAIRAGAFDFVTKPIDDTVLMLAIERAGQHRQLREEVKRLRTEVAAGKPTAEFQGKSAVFRQTLDLLARMSQSDAAVLLAGESGTGKELAARRLHELSPRHKGPFVAINCAAMPDQLLESELFGHIKGAFTDAKAPRAGLFTQANAGTLFLDEVGELPLSLQPKLLRALQERRVRPVGSDVEVAFDARILSATNRDLETEIEAGRFREDLFFRLNVITIDMPPLRLRGGDVLLLAQRFVEQLAARASKRVTGISVEAAKKLMNYPWPGNVRELHNCIERAIAYTTSEQLVVGDLPERISGHRVSLETTDESEIVTLEENERRYVARVVNAVGGNKSHAARLLGIDRKSLWRRLSKPSEEST
jgi:two-component system, NtrC family, response regulator AtoC